MPEPARTRILRELHLAAFGVPLLGLESWVTDRLTGLLEEDSARAGHRLFSAGEVADSFCFVLEGSVEIARAGAPPWILGRRSVLGMTDALIERPRQHTATALTEVSLMRVRMDAWLDLLEDCFELARASVTGVANAVARLEESLWTMQRPLATSGARPGFPVTSKLNVVERLALLMDAPILGGAGIQPLSDLAVACEEVVTEEGSPIFGRGGAGGRVFVLVAGTASGMREDPRAVWHGSAGDIVCGAAALGERLPAWEARAATRTTALAFRLEDWFDLMEENFDMVRSTLSALLTHRQSCLDQLATGIPGAAQAQLAFD
jgi:CRP-like cAMP-binding protein